MYSPYHLGASGCCKTMSKQTNLKEELHLWPENFPTTTLTLQHLMKDFFLIKVNFNTEIGSGQAFLEWMQK